MNRWKKIDKKILPPPRSDGSEAQKPRWRKPLPLDETAYSADARKRFWKKVIRGNPDDCWKWIGALTHDGYGRFGNNRKTVVAHRVAFRMEVGEIPEEMLVCHTCDNPPCCNPRHFVLGTQWDNTLDKMAKGRYATGERSGAHTHPEKIRRGDNHPFRLDPTMHAFGEGVNTAKLTAEKVIRIRRFYASRKFSAMSLAKRFGVSVSNIRFIVDGRTWKHLL